MDQCICFTAGWTSATPLGDYGWTIYVTPAATPSSPPYAPLSPSPPPPLPSPPTACTGVSTTVLDQPPGCILYDPIATFYFNHASASTPTNYMFTFACGCPTSTPPSPPPLPPPPSPPPALPPPALPSPTTALCIDRYWPLWRRRPRPRRLRRQPQPQAQRSAVQDGHVQRLWWCVCLAVLHIQPQPTKHAGSGRNLRLRGERDQWLAPVPRGHSARRHALLGHAPFLLGHGNHLGPHWYRRRAHGRCACRLHG